MLPLKFAYLTGCFLFFVPWLLLFLHRKDLRQEMLIMGGIGAIGSFLTAYFWTLDWWHPLTITNSRIGLEDLFVGFTNAGIAAVLYEEVFRKKLIKRRGLDHTMSLAFLVGLTATIFLILFQFLQYTSFSGCIIALVIFSAILISLRHDLFVSSFINGFLMVLVALPVYYVLMFLFPGFIEQTYHFNTLSGFLITGIPLEELVFYYIFGFMVGLLYEYWKGLSIRNISKRKR